MLQSVFNTILIQSVTAGSLALFIIMLKPLTTKIFNALWQYYIWIIIIVWLIMPCIPNISAIDNYVISTNKQISTFSPNIMIYKNSVQKLINYDNVNLAFTSINIQIKQLMSWIWLVGVLFFTVYYIYKYVKFHLILKRNSFVLTNPNILSIFDECKTNIGIKRDILVCCSNYIGTPFLSGLFKSVITVPNTNFNADEYKLIFIHELTHYKRKDLWYKIIALAANIIHWFNPIIYMIVKNINEACEYACDESVIHNMNYDEKKRYSQTILNIITLQTDKKIIMLTALRGIRKIERRINMILKFKKSKRSIVIVGIIAVIVLGIGGGFISSFTGKVLGINDSENKELQEMYDFYLKLDKTMAKAFDINLNDYRKIDTLPGFIKPEHKELNIGDIKEQLHLKYGDKIPSVYLNKENTKGIALTQDLQGVYMLYEFENNKDKNSRFKWKITNKKTVQGEYTAVNENVKEYFKKNPIAPTYEYESNGNELTITITK